MKRRTLLIGAAALLAACVPVLRTFNALTPKDSGGRRVRRNIAYGQGRRRDLDLYAPAVMPIGMPIIVFIHGGAWNSGDKGEYTFVGDALSSRGFLTVVPNYRLVPQVRFPEFIEDCALAVRWISDHAAELGGDPSRIVLMGHSAGAYNAMMLGLDPRYLRQAGVNAQSIKGVIGVSGPYDFLPLDVKVTQDAFGNAGNPEATQPTRFARQDGPPLLLMWGDKDTRVGQRSINAMQQAAQSAGESVDTRIYPNVDHAGMLLALSRFFRGNGPVLQDATDFARRVTA
jgi:acetyl esterase/lipase